MKQNKILVTGGSGFIGTNLIDYLLEKNYTVKSFDIKTPQKLEHTHIYETVDILNEELLFQRSKAFSPNFIIHLAAKTDLIDDARLSKYQANIKGVENICKITNQISTIKRVIFTSTKLVCPTDYKYKHKLDFHPTTDYGRSKARGEKIVRNYDLQKEWCIVRPTSIWGPWSLSNHIPYGRFFQYIAKGYYFHPEGTDAPKTYGYVGNTCYQLEQLLYSKKEEIHEDVFFLLDYESFIIKDWANLISLKIRGKRVKSIPIFLVKILAIIGDMFKVIGIKEPPFSSFRLKNMKANTSQIPFDRLQKITGSLPYNMETGVEMTINWLKEKGEI